MNIFSFHHHRYQITVDLGKTHLVLGKYGCDDLTSQETSLIQDLIPNANLNTAIIYHHVMINSYIYSTISYQRRTNCSDNLLCFIKQNTKSIGSTIKFISLCKSICSSDRLMPCQHVIVLELFTPLEVITVDPISKRCSEHHHIVQNLYGELYIVFAQYSYSYNVQYLLCIEPV